MKRRRHWVIAAAVVIVLTSLGGVLWWAIPDREPPGLTADGATELAADLRSGDPERIRHGLAMPDGAEVSAETAEAMARFIISIDVTTFETGPDNTATAAGTVQVVDEPGAPTEVTLFLIYVDDRWRLVDAVPREGDSTS